MNGLVDKTLPELEGLAQQLREAIAREPQRSRADLEDVEWEIEKRHWRKDAPLRVVKQGAKDSPFVL